MDHELNRYELAYLLSPSLDEQGIPAFIQEMTKELEVCGGKITRSELPRKRMLAYSVEKGRQAYFGWVTFDASPARAREVEKIFRAKNRVMRILLTTSPVRTEKMWTPHFKPASPAAKEDSVPTILREQESPDEKIDLEALDRRLEEILGA